MKKVFVFLSLVAATALFAQTGGATKSLDQVSEDAFSRMRKMMEAQSKMMNQMMNSLVTDQGFDDFDSTYGSSGPEVIRKDEPKVVLYELKMNGVDKNSLNVVVENGMVKISGQTRIEKIDEEENFRGKSVSVSSFSKSFPVPEDVEATSFSMEEKDKNTLILKFNKRRI